MNAADVPDEVVAAAKRADHEEGVRDGRSYHEVADHQVRRLIAGAVAAERERLAREGVYLMHHCFERGEEFGVFARQEDAEAAADRRRAKGNPGALIQVLGCAVIGAESAPDPPWVQALGERANPADPLRAPGA